MQSWGNDSFSNEMMETLLQFTIGQEVESKSHSQGYRGAWFRCKIVDIDRGSRGLLRFKLRYIHFPDEALHWSQAYQQRQRGNASTIELMLRPPMPPVVAEKDFSGIMFHGLVVVVRPWEVGDLVNFWCDDVWWECVVTEILDLETVKVSLFRPPHGEGGHHCVKGKALRPSLVWTLKDGWSVPPPKKNSHAEQCARLVQLSSNIPKENNFSLRRVRGTYVETIQETLSQQLPRSLEDRKSFPETLTSVRLVPDLTALRRVLEPLADLDVQNEGGIGNGQRREMNSAAVDEVFVRTLEERRCLQKKNQICRRRVCQSVTLLRLHSNKRKRTERQSVIKVCRSYMRYKVKGTT